MGYPELARNLRRVGITQDRLNERNARELFRRMVFNILVDNTDDPEKNHALLVAQPFANGRAHRWRRAAEPARRLRRCLASVAARQEKACKPISARVKAKPGALKAERVGSSRAQARRVPPRFGGGS